MDLQGGEVLRPGVEPRTGIGYGVVVVAVVEADAVAGEASFVGTIDGLASMRTMRVLVAVLPQVSVAT
jgi:hypothetical protein